MATPSTTESTESKKRDKKEASDRTDEILQQLNRGDLHGQVQVILLLGAAGSGKTNFVKLMSGSNIHVEHGLMNGTEEPHCMLTRIKQQLFLFIDTPGFGHPELSNNKVEEAIYKMLGYFTRVLGHIHGVLYFQSILEDRVSPGMKDSAEFLRKLIPANKLDRLTFITTKWDTVAPKVKRIREAKESELIEEEWAVFRINKASGARSFQLDVDCDFGTMDEKTDARKRVVNEVLNQYQVASHMGLFMPFNQWTNGEKTFYVVTAPVRGLIWVIENTSFSVGVGVDADIRF